MIKNINSYNSKRELYEFLGMTRGPGTRYIDKYLTDNNLGLDYFTSINRYERNPNYCIECKSEIEFSKRINKFCSSSCSATNTNKGKIKSDLTKFKISEKLISLHSLIPKVEIRECLECKLEYKISERNRSKCCSDKCTFNLRSNNKKSEIKTRKKLGLHVGWVSRNVLSYPEKFFIEVLKNNNLFHLCKTNYRQGKYFLDFYFENIKLDLEIDGGQHEWEDRKASDISRDKYLESEGIITHRIPWKSLNTDEGKTYIKKEIDMFLELYNKLNKSHS